MIQETNIYHKFTSISKTNMFWLYDALKFIAKWDI